MLFSPPLPAVLDTAHGIPETQTRTSIDLQTTEKLAADPLLGTARWRLSSLLAIASWPKRRAIALCGLLLGVILITDLKTGSLIELSPLYFLPIIVASLRFHGVGGVTVAAVSAVLATRFSPEAMGKAHDLSAFLVNALTLWISFSFVALVTGAAQRQREHLHQKRLELQEAHQRLRADIRAAELLQTHLLRRPLPNVPGLEIAVDIRFARGVGGDFYDVRQVGRHLSVCVADVSGKGPQAALISAALRAFLDEGAGKLPAPHQFLHHLNRHLDDALPEEMFVTMFYGLLDPESGELRYASAGHDPPLLCRGEVVEELLPTAPALGFVPELHGCTECVTIQPGEMLLIYTDGLTTARSPTGERDCEELIRRELPGIARLPAGEAVTRLFELAYPGEGRSVDDDVAILVLRRP